MDKIITFRKIAKKHGFRCALTSTKQHILYNFAGIYMSRYDLSTFERSDSAKNQVLWVSPSDIEYFQPSLFDRFLNEFDRNKYPDPVVGGHWDRLRVSIDDRVFYRSLEEHFLNGVPWEDTMFIEQCLNDLENGYTTWHGCENPKDLWRKAKEVDNIYKSILNQGYKTHGERNKEPTSEVRINIDRSGSLIQSVDGKHRITIAKLLNINQIPVCVFCRHKLWESRRKSSKYASHPDALSQ